MGSVGFDTSVNERNGLLFGILSRLIIKLSFRSYQNLEVGMNVAIPIVVVVAWRCQLSVKEFLLYLVQWSYRLFVTAFVL